MRARWVLALLLVAVLSGGCSALGLGSDAKSDSAPVPVGHHYDTMPLDEHAEQALTFMPALVDAHIDYKIHEEATATAAADKTYVKDYVDVRGVEPVFVGYGVIAWETSAREEVKYIEVPYLNGHTANSLRSPEVELIEAPEIYSFDESNTRPMPESPSGGEKAAVDSARARLGYLLPDRAWRMGVKYYLFLYKVGTTGMVMGTTLDGELAIYSRSVAVAP